MSEAEAGAMRIVESYDIGSDWPWRFSVEQWVPAGRFLWWNTAPYWRTILSGKKLETCKAFVANGGQISRVVLP